MSKSGGILGSWTWPRGARKWCSKSGSPEGRKRGRGDRGDRDGRVNEFKTAAAQEVPGASLLTDKQSARLEDVLAIEVHIEVDATWGIYQRLVPAYRGSDKKLMQALIDAVSSGVPAALVEIRRHGRTLKQRAVNILAFFGRPGTINGPTEANNARLEHLRGSALGFRNLTNYIARSFLEIGGFRPLLQPRLR